MLHVERYGDNMLKIYNIQTLLASSDTCSVLICETNNNDTFTNAVIYRTAKTPTYLIYVLFNGELD